LRVFFPTVGITHSFPITGIDFSSSLFQVLGKSLKHDDVLVVPEFFCKEDDWSLYYQLVEELREAQSKGEKNAEWISWHEVSNCFSTTSSFCVEDHHRHSPCLLLCLRLRQYVSKYCPP
jgi:hypothetical protein